MTAVKDSIPASLFFRPEDLPLRWTTSTKWIVYPGDHAEIPDGAKPLDTRYLFSLGLKITCLEDGTFSIEGRGV